MQSLWRKINCIRAPLPYGQSNPEYPKSVNGLG